jgi:hypothetical protein
MAGQGKNKDIETLQARVRELEKELEERDAAAAAAMADCAMSQRSGRSNRRIPNNNKGEPYNEKPFYWTFEVRHL